MEKIRYKQWDNEDKKYYLREETPEELSEYLTGTLEQYLDCCKDDSRIGDKKTMQELSDLWDKLVEAKDEYIEISVSSTGPFLNIEVEIFGKIQIKLTATRTPLDDTYEVLRIESIKIHPFFLEFGYQAANVIDHVAWALGSEKTEYKIVQCNAFENAFLLFNGYEKDVVNKENEIYLVKHHRDEYGYIIRNERQARDVSPEDGE